MKIINNIADYIEENNKIAFVIVAIVAFFVYFTRFIFSGDGYLAFYEDDYFYYLKIAENFAKSGVSTFNGIHLTNGYHPLWMLINAFLVKIVGSSSKSFFVLLSTFILTTTLLTFNLVKKLIYLFITNKYIVLTISFLFMERYITLAKGGMEVIIAVPAILYLTYFTFKNFVFTNNFSKNNYLILGLLISLTILSRIDTLIIVALLLGSTLFISRKSININLTNILNLLIGLTPLFIYFIINYKVFDTLMPISSTAKQLKDNFAISKHTLFSLATSTFHRKVNFIYLILNIVLQLFIVIKYKKELFSNKKLLLLFVVSMFYLVHILSISILSGWLVWYWYTYSILISTLSVLLLFFTKSKSNEQYLNNKLIMFSSLILLITINLAFVYSVKPNSNIIYREAKQIENWSKLHTGIVGIGDKAGLASF